MLVRLLITVCFLVMGYSNLNAQRFVTERLTVWRIPNELLYATSQGIWA